MSRRIAILISACLAGTTGMTQAESVGDLFERVNSSVVEIATQEREIAPQGGNQFISVAGLGSGVLISEDGLILTAAHVIQAADTIKVRFLNGEIVEADVLASEPSADVALVQVKKVPEDLHVAELADSDEVEVGDKVFVIGAPLGVSHTLTVGHLSARRAPNSLAGSMLSTELLQTDAAINPGNSGGPMFNMEGQVIGIVSHIISLSGGAEGLGFGAAD